MKAAREGEGRNERPSPDWEDPTTIKGMGFLFLSSIICTIAAAQSRPPRKDIPTIAKAADGAIVSIVMSNNDKPIAEGSGFFVSKDGLIVTNYHVIAEGSSAVVKLPGGAFYVVVDGVLATDKTRDIAVIKAHGRNFRTLVLGNSDRIQVGDEVVAIGNPLSLESTVSNGIVSGIRSINEKDGKYLQITAPISPGSSGGPLFNMAGDVIGITTMHLKGGENLNFAIPINDAKRMLVAKSEVRDFPKEGKEVQPEKTHANAPLLEQKMCSEQAAQKLKEYIAEDRASEKIDDYGQTSHYDPSEGVCYVRLLLQRNVLHDKDDSVFSGKVEQFVRNFKIVDAFGGATVGQFILTGPLRDNPELFVCEIRPPNQPKIHCNSEKESDDLAEKYFGVQ